MESTPVLIVGGGLAGLTAACFLSLHNINCILLEKHERSSPHPRAVGFTTRTMEIFEKLGIVDQVPQTTADFRLRRMAVESLAGEWKGEMGARAAHATLPMLDYSHFLGAAIAQDKLEPILRTRAKELGCDIRFGHRMLALEPPREVSETIKVTIRHLEGHEYSISAGFVLAADGHRSSIRSLLNINTTGRGHLKTINSVLFRAPDLDKYLSKGVHQFAISQSDLEAFLTTYNDGRWVLMFSDEKQRSDHELHSAILQATGIPDLSYEQIATGIWDLRAQIADTFIYPPTSTPTIFLLGDAAHTLPPTRGGYGANTGIADAHNLAWKLASVIKGTSSPTLLSTYDTERRPVSWLRHDQIFAGPDYAAYKRDGEDYGRPLNPVAVELGQVYQSAIIAAENNQSSSGQYLALTPDELAGRPGSRAPHVWLADASGQRVSVLSLLADEWTIVTSNLKWKEVAAAATEETNIPLLVLFVGDGGLQEEKEGSLADRFGLPDGAASLIRPDGYVAWRSGVVSGEREAERDLVAALRRAACML